MLLTFSFFKISLWTCFKWLTEICVVVLLAFHCILGKAGAHPSQHPANPIPLLLNACYLGSILYMMPQMCLYDVVTDHIKACPSTNLKNLTAGCSVSSSSGSWRDSTLTQVWDIATYCGVISVIKNKVNLSSSMIIKESLLSFILGNFRV